MVIKGTITKRNIELGIKQDKNSCPLGLSLRAKGFTGVVVTQHIVKVDHPTKGDDLVALIPGELNRWIVALDNDQPVEPIHYRLELE